MHLEAFVLTEAVGGHHRAPGRARLWPAALWIAHLAVPFFIVLYVALRREHHIPLGVLWTTVGAAGVIWLALGSVVLLAPRGREWLARRRRELLLAFISVGVVGAFGDVLLTVTGTVPTFDDLYSKYALHYRPGAHTLGRLEPNQSLQIPDGPLLEINSRGYRGPAVTIPKPAGVSRLIFLGGSQVFDQYGSNWPVRVGELLSTPGSPVDVINAGVPSHRTADSIGKCLTELWMWEPDLIVVCQAWNDIKYFSRLGPDTPYSDLFQPRTDDWRIPTNSWDAILGGSAFYRLVHTRIRGVTHGAEGEVRRPPTGSVSEWGVRQYRLDLELLCDLAANLGARAVLCKQARLPAARTDGLDRAKIAYDYVGLDHAELLRAFAECDRVIDEVAGEKGVPVIDLHAALSGRSELFSDHIHFNERGSMEAAQVMAAALAQYVAADHGRSTRELPSGLPFRESDREPGTGTGSESGREPDTEPGREPDPLGGRTP